MRTLLFVFSLLLLTLFSASDACGQLANASLNIITLSSGQVPVGGVVDLQVTIGNTGPTSPIGANKVRVQISIPSIAGALPNSQQTGLPPGWMITVNNVSSITICNGTDAIPVGVQRQIFIKIRGNTVGGPSTINGSLSFLNGASCTIPGTLQGDNTADNVATTSIQVVAVVPCTLGVTASAGTIACNGGTTTLTATANGTAGAVEYSLNGGAFQASNTFTVNASGSPYTITARELSNPTCTATSTPVTVTEPVILPAPTINIVQPSCTVATGIITVTSSTAGLTFSLDGGTYAAYPASGYPVATGSHTLTAQSTAGCVSGIANATIDAQPGSPAIPTTTVVQPTCATVTGTITITSSVTGLTFSLDGGTYATYPSGGYVVTSGTHTLTAQNASNCISPVANITVNTQPATPAAPIPGTITQPTCAISTGSVVLSGLPSGNWTINPGNITGSTTTTTINNLDPGTYNFTVTNGSGCASAPSANVVINTVPGAPATPIYNIVQPGCTVPTATITITSPTAGLTFSLDGGTYVPYPAGGYIVAPGSSYNLTAQSASSCISSVAHIIIDAQPATPTAPIAIVAAPCTVTTGTVELTGLPPGNWTINPGNITGNTTSMTINGLAPGTYNYTVTNSVGCTSLPSADIIITAVAGTPSAPAVNIIQPNCTLATGTITVTSTTTGLTFSLDGGAYATYPAGGYAVAAGAHTLKAQNTGGCISDVTSITIDAQPPSPAMPAINIVQPTCTAPIGIITITSTVTGLTFSLDGGVYVTYPAGGYAVAAGAHTLIAQNTVGCTSPVLNITINTPGTSPAATASATTITCFSGMSTLTVTVSRGTPPFEYSPDGGGNYQPSNTFQVGAGTYEIIVRDANLCTGSTGPVVITQPLAIVASASSAAGPIGCTGTTTFTVTAANGIAPLQYSLNGGAFQSANIFTVGTGTHTVTVKDANNCTATTAPVTVTLPGTLKATATAGRISQCGGKTEVTVIATGGVPPYASGVGNFTRGPGTWTFTITDDSGCSSTAEVTIEAPACMNLQVHPNPGKNTIIVNHSIALPGSKMQVYEINGALVMTKTVPQDAFLTTLDMSKYAAGTYMIVYLNGTERNERKATLFVKTN